MKFIETTLPGVMIVEPRVFTDERGFFMETWHAERFGAAGIRHSFVQDNHSRSLRGTLRGLHYQVGQPQGKLVRVVAGEVFDVAVDLRRSSPSFGCWAGVVLSASNRRQLWVPPGFAHGFLAVSDSADVVYKCTELYAPHAERVLRWDDPAIGVEWPMPAGVRPLLSPKDAAGASFGDAEKFD